MKIDFLQDIPLETVNEAFNEAFRHYFLPVHGTPADLQARMKRDDLRLELSTGAFEGDGILGFMLQGGREEGGEKILYNGGTGVVMAARGQGLTLRQYDWLVPRIKQQGYTRLLLEVIRENAPAIHVYRKAGFEVTRELDSFVGHVQGFPVPKGIEILAVKGAKWTSEPHWEDFAPSWQHADTSLDNAWDEAAVLEARLGEERVGYIAALPNGRLMQYAVRPEDRGKGIGKALFYAMYRHLGRTMLNVINVERMAQPLDRFFIDLGLNPSFYQYEMERRL